MNVVRDTADEIFRSLASTAAGLDDDEAQRRLRRDGPNELPRARPTHALRLLFAQVSHMLALLLWAGAGLAFVAGLPQLGWAILAIVAVNALFSFWQEYRASRLVEALHRRLPAAVLVRRNGVEQRIVGEDLVSGDLLLVRRGDRVGADARLIQAADLQLDYSSLTGESQPVERNAEPASPVQLVDAANCVLAGTIVLEGSGESVVFATGKSTVFGQVAELTQRVYLEPSPLQRELALTARAIAVIAVTIGLAFFLAGNLSGHLSTKDSFIFAIGILVAIVPEGLLPTVTLALALAVQRIGRGNAIVKRLSSVEALGCTTIICTDKTGTITTNEMTAKEVWAGDLRYDVSRSDTPLPGSLPRFDRGLRSQPSALAMLLRCAVLCNNGITSEQRAAGTEIEDPLDNALIALARRAGLNPGDEQRVWQRVREFPFHAERRLMATLNERANQHCLFVKGAPLETLARCVAELRDSTSSLLDQARLRELERITNEISSRGLRVLAFAFREVSGPDVFRDADQAEQSLVFLGLVAFANPLRPEVAEAVRRCHTAGVQVVMLTGDYPNTAVAVAGEAGIAGPGTLVVTGVDLDGLGDEGLAKLLGEQSPAIFARVTPEHKLRLVQAYQALGHVVAVTGDGVNDAPALKAAEIGVAMGRTGTDVAREAADMILLDDNFATIVRAVEEGRAVYSNIRKFLTYVLTSNVAEALPFALFILAGVPLPLTILQVLLVDLGTDMLPAIALGVDPPDRDIMERPPRSKRERIVTPALMLRALGFLGMLAGGLSLGGYFYVQSQISGSVFHGLVSEGPLYRQATTMTLAGIVACQIANAFACRSERESVLGRALIANRMLLVAVAAEIALLAAFIGLPPLRHMFDLEPIPAQYWPILVALPPLFLLAEEARKLLVRLAYRLRPDMPPPA